MLILCSFYTYYLMNKLIAISLVLSVLLPTVADAKQLVKLEMGYGIYEGFRYLALARDRCRSCAQSWDIQDGNIVSDLSNKPEMDADRAAKADVVLRVKVEKSAEPFLGAYNKVTFKVLEVYKATDTKIGGGSLEKGREFWLTYFRSTGTIEAGEMTVYLHLKKEFVQVGMQPLHSVFTLELLNRSAIEGVSHFVTKARASNH